MRELSLSPLLFRRLSGQRLEDTQGVLQVKIWERQRKGCRQQKQSGHMKTKEPSAISRQCKRKETIQKGTEFTVV